MFEKEFLRKDSLAAEPTQQENAAQFVRHTFQNVFYCTIFESTNANSRLTKTLFSFKMCPKAFSKSSNLYAHKRMHIGCKYVIRVTPI